MTAFVLVASCGAALPARAADGRPIVEALQVRSGAACVQRDTLAVQIGAWLGKRTIDRDLAVVVVGSASDAQEITFELRRGAAPLASRRFYPAPVDCAALEAILALAIAMALEVTLRDQLLASLGSERRSELKSSLAAFAELGLGLLPEVSAGVAVRAGLRVRSLVALRWDVLTHTSQNTGVGAASAGLAVDAWLVGTRVAACLLIPLARALAASACAGLGAGGLKIGGQGYRGARAVWLPWLDVALGAELSVALSRHWSIDAGGNLELPLGTRSYGVRNADGTLAVSRTLPGVAATLRAGPAYHF